MRAVFILVLFLVFALGMRVIQNTAQVVPQPNLVLADYWAAARGGKDVSLVIKNVVGPDDFEAVLADGGAETSIGWAAFHVRSPASFTFDFGSVLATLPKCPTPGAKVIVRSKNGGPVAYQSISVK